MCGKRFDRLDQLRGHAGRAHRKRVRISEDGGITLLEPRHGGRGELGGCIGSSGAPSDLWKRPKSATEVLREVLEDHGLRPDFVEYASKRSERMGGLHPNELWSLLTDMDSGVKTKAHARYVVDDYYFALQQEQAKAREAGARASYPLRMGEAEPLPFYSSFHEQTPYPTYEALPVRKQPYEPYPRRDYGRAPTREEVREWITQALEEKRKRDELSELKEKIASLESSLRAQAPSTGLTREELQQALEAHRRDEEARLMRERLEMERELRKVEREELLKRVEDLAKRVEEGRSVHIPPAQYSDSKIQFADTIARGLIPELGRRMPVKWVIEAIPTLTGEQRSPPPIAPPSGKYKIEDFVSPEYVVENCPNCGAEVTMRDHACPRCGVPLPRHPSPRVTGAEPITPVVKELRGEERVKLVRKEEGLSKHPI